MAEKGETVRPPEVAALDPRRTRVERLLAGLAALICTTLLAGCNGDDENKQTSAPPFAGVALDLHVPEDSELAPFWEPLIHEWNARTGATATVRPYRELPDGANGTPAVFVLPLERYAEFASDAKVSVVDTDTVELYWGEVLRGLRDRVTRRGREPRLVPIATPVLVCAFRADLLEAAGLQPPETWDDYHTLVTTLSEWAPGLDAVEPWGADSRATMFTARSIAYASPPGSLSFYFDLESGGPVVNTPGFEKALDVTARTVPLLSDKSWDLSPEGCREELLAGRAAIGICCEPVVRDHGSVARSENARLAYARLPGSAKVYSRTLGEWQQPGLNRPGLAGFAGLCGVVTDGGSPAWDRAAFNLLATVAAETASSSGSPVRALSHNFHVDSGTVLFQPPLSFAEATDYVRTNVATLRDPHLVLDLPVVHRDDFAAALAQVLTRDALAGQSPTALLEQLNAAWQGVLEERGSDTVLESYRRSVGLK